MTRLSLRFTATVLVALVAACAPVNSWQSNATGIVSGDPVLRESRTLAGSTEAVALDTLTNTLNLMIPSDATIESVATVDMEWAEGGYVIEGATVLRMQFPRSEAEAFGRTTPCRILAFDEWKLGAKFFTYPWVFDLINEKPNEDAYVCMEPVLDQPPGPTRNMIAIISNSDPVNVVIATYPSPSD